MPGGNPQAGADRPVLLGRVRLARLAPEDHAPVGRGARALDRDLLGEPPLETADGLLRPGLHGPEDGCQEHHEKGGYVDARAAHRGGRPSAAPSNTKRPVLATTRALRPFSKQS
jgi:hypothetical protein